MRRRTALIFAVAVAGVFSAATIAMAEGALTLSASAAKLTVPHTARLTVGFPTSEPATATILVMRAGTSEWTTTTLSATTATPTVRVRPRVTSTYKAWLSDESSSAPVTIEVAAKLSKPQINGYVRHGRSYTVKGTMQPAEVGTVTVGYYRMETASVRMGNGHTKRVAKWVIHHSDEVALKSVNPQLAKWTVKWTPSESGWWKVVVSHEDVTHVYSSRTTYKWVR